MPAGEIRHLDHNSPTGHEQHECGSSAELDWTEGAPMTTTTEQLPRMRVRKGRVMHVVKRRRSNELESACRKSLGVKGVSTTYARVAAAPVEDWTTDNLLNYPDCKHCPTDAAS